MGVRQPRVQWRQSNLGTVTEQQEDEGDVEQGRIKLTGADDQLGPHHAVEPFADDRPGGDVDQNGAEQRQRDADAAENEVLPGRFERLVGAVDADHEHGGQRRHLDGNPHQPDIVGDQREVHRKHQHLVHGVIEPHEGRLQPPDFELMVDVARTKYAGGEADEGGEHDERAVEIVDQEIVAWLRSCEE